MSTATETVRGQQFVVIADGSVRLYSIQEVIVGGVAGHNGRLYSQQRIQLRPDVQEIVAALVENIIGPGGPGIALEQGFEFPWGHSDSPPVHNTSETQDEPA